MRKGIILFLALCPIVLHSAEADAIKQTLAVQQQRLALASSHQEKSEIFYQLAVAYFQDQEIDQAFIHFLEALKWAEKKEGAQMSPEESALYLAALDDYLAHAGTDPLYAAQTLLEEHGEAANQHPAFLHLNFLIATAYANLGQYDTFFDRFYRGYPYMSESFLAYKTKGILYLRLSQRSHSPQARLAFQKEALHDLKRALELSPQDASLYKVLIFLAKDEKNDEQVRAYLDKMIGHQAPVPRTDICLYVTEAVALGEYGMAQAIIDQARLLYEYSRAVSAAQEYLNQNKG